MVRGWRLEVSGWKLEVGSWRLVVGGWGWGVGGWRRAARFWTAAGAGRFGFGVKAHTGTQGTRSGEQWGVGGCSWQGSHVAPCCLLSADRYFSSAASSPRRSTLRPTATGDPPGPPLPRAPCSLLTAPCCRSSAASSHRRSTRRLDRAPEAFNRPPTAGTASFGRKSPG